MHGVLTPPRPPTQTGNHRVTLGHAVRMGAHAELSLGCSSQGPHDDPLSRDFFGLLRVPKPHLAFHPHPVRHAIYHASTLFLRNCITASLTVTIGTILGNVNQRTR